MKEEEILRQVELVEEKILADIKELSSLYLKLAIINCLK